MTRFPIALVVAAAVGSLFLWLFLLGASFK